jgi:hypothetical protein
MTEEQLKRLAALEASDQAMASAIKETTTIAERDALMKAFAELFMAELDRDVLDAFLQRRARDASIGELAIEWPDETKTTESFTEH